MDRVIEGILGEDVVDQEIVGGAEALRQSQTDTTDLLIDQVFPHDIFKPHEAESPDRAHHLSSGEPS